jgi:hypothetical protein
MSSPLANTQLLEISALIGTVFPMIAAFAKQSGFSRRANVIVCVALSIVAGVITSAANGNFSIHNVVGSFIAIYGVATVFYTGLWKNLGEPTLTHITSIYKDGVTEGSDPAVARGAAPPNPLV